MNTLVLLAIILFVLMKLVGGKKGTRSFLALFLNFGVLLLTILLMSFPAFNAIFLAIIACAIISCITLFYVNEVNVKTITAFLSTLITIIILILFILPVTEQAMIQGFVDEEIHEIEVFSLYIGIDFVNIAAAVIIMSTIGAIIDIAISISSPMREIFNHNPHISSKELFKSGLSIGRDILGTSVNTLLFAFLGSYMALLIWFKDLDYSLGRIVNSQVFSAEMMTILCAGIGLTLVIPITCWITAYFLVTRPNNK